MKIYLENIFKNYPFIILFRNSICLSAILLTLDLLDKPSMYLGMIDVRIIQIVAGAGIISIILTVFEYNLFETIKMRSINFNDGLAMITIFSSVMYAVVIDFNNQFYEYKKIIISIISLFFICIMYFRGRRIVDCILAAKEYKSNIVDLNKIFTGEFNIKNGETIFVNEKDVDYDLLQRESIINHIYNSIIKCNPDIGFVISLEGKWGCGKTTLINNVKKKIIDTEHNTIIIDEFDPWSYCDQESLFVNMFDIIIKKSGINYSVLSTKRMVANLSESIFGSQKTNSLIKGFSKQISEIDKTKAKINEFLKLCGKKVVFFIDNIDRAESENIILLFKLVGNVFDFERVIYVLSFDNERVKKIFDSQLSIDYQFLKKVIQMQIRVPEIDRDVFNKLIAQCVNNLLISYGESEDNIKNYRSIIDCLCNPGNDLRDFKRFINSVIGVPFNSNKYLYFRDLMAIELIHLYNPSLYQEIYQHREFFISHDRIYDKEIYSMSIARDRFNLAAVDYFNRIFSEDDNKKYTNILEVVFPYVKKYKTKQDLEREGAILSPDESAEIQKNRRICSAKYFDLYFSYSDNEFLVVSRIVANFIDNIKIVSDFDEKESIFLILLDTMHPSFQKEIFEIIQLYTDDFIEKNAYDFTRILFNNIHRIDNSSAFFALNAKKRVEVIIWELLNKVSDDYFTVFIDDIKLNYEKIDIISSLLYWFEHDSSGKNKEGRKEKLNEIYITMGDTIIKNSINLYDDENYFPKNIWGLCRLYEEDETIIKNYINKIVNISNIFRLINDCIKVSTTSRTYKYSISEKSLNTLTTEEHIDQILINIVPVSEDQQFVFDVYNAHKAGIKDHWGETGIETSEEKNLMLKP